MIAGQQPPMSKIAIFREEVADRAARRQGLRRCQFRDARLRGYSGSRSSGFSTSSMLTSLKV
ncbi:hypothetical protein, partial [Mycolicibacterium pulveris]